MRPMLYLNKNPFFQILLTALENHPKEATGMLFGIRDKAPDTVDYEIFSALSHTCTQERNEETIAEDFPSMLRIIEGNKKLSGLDYLGGFHSHPDEDAEFSREDKDYLKSKGKETVEVVIGLEELAEVDEFDLGWEIIDDDREINGIFSIGAQIFEVSIRAYRLLNKKIEVLDLRAEYTEILEALEKYGVAGFHSLGDIVQYARSYNKDIYELYDLLDELSESLEEKKKIIKTKVKAIKNFLEIG